MPWYDLQPEEYAKSLRYGADRQEECAKFKDKENKPWSAHEATINRKIARRLRAMAILCDQSNASRAGNIDFRLLNDPTISSEYEERIVTEIETSYEKGNKK